jgi:hypothetical protein
MVTIRLKVYGLFFHPKMTWKVGQMSLSDISTACIKASPDCDILSACNNPPILANPMCDNYTKSTYTSIFWPTQGVTLRPNVWNLYYQPVHGVKTCPEVLSVQIEQFPWTGELFQVVIHGSVAELGTDHQKMTWWIDNVGSCPHFLPIIQQCRFQPLIFYQVIWQCRFQPFFF